MKRTLAIAMGLSLLSGAASAQVVGDPPIDITKVPTGTDRKAEMQYGTLIIIPSGKQSAAVEEANKKLVLEWFDDFWNKGNFENWPKWMSADFRNHDPIEPPVGAQALADWLNDRLKTNARGKPKPKNPPAKLFAVAEGDLVFIAHMPVIPSDPSRDPAVKFGSNMLRVKNGKIVEWWYSGQIVGMGGDSQGGGAAGAPRPATPPGLATPAN